MLFNTVEYILFLPVVVVLYYLLPAKARPIWLLGISYYFYMQWDAKYVLLLFFCTLALCGRAVFRTFQRQTGK